MGSDPKPNALVAELKVEIYRLSMDNTKLRRENSNLKANIIELKNSFREITNEDHLNYLKSIAESLEKIANPPMLIRKEDLRGN